MIATGRNLMPIMTLYTKRRFAKCLANHKAEIIDCRSERLATNPNEIWRIIGGNKSKGVASELPSESDWINYFTSEFSPPDPVLKTLYESLLVDSLVDTESEISFVVTASDIYSAIIHLRKKFSRGYDQLCGFHLLHASDKLLQHLHLFYQIIFNSGIVPDSFCVGTLTPVPKKDKDSRQCCSYRPITVSSFCVNCWSH